jgi:hypothetical protein
MMEYWGDIGKYPFLIAVFFANLVIHVCLSVQESTIGASFFTKTIPEKHIKFEIW